MSRVVILGIRDLTTVTLQQSRPVATGHGHLAAARLSHAAVVGGLGEAKVVVGDDRRGPAGVLLPPVQTLLRTTQ